MAIDRKFSQSKNGDFPWLRQFTRGYNSWMVVFGNFLDFMDVAYPWLSPFSDTSIDEISLRLGHAFCVTESVMELPVNVM